MTTTKLTVNGSFTQFIQPLRELTAFTTHGSLRGAPITRGYVESYGALSRAHQDDLYAVQGNVDYVVYSYATPIAYHVKAIETTPARWIEPVARYSVTTSKQQGRIGAAISFLTDPSY